MIKNLTPVGDNRPGSVTRWKIWQGPARRYAESRASRSIPAS